MSSALAILCSVPELVVVSLLEPTDPEFDRARWPAHVTLLTNVAFDGAANEVVALMRPIASAFSPIPIRPGLQDRFGPDRDIGVVRVDPVEALAALHDALVGSIIAAGGLMLVPYWGANFAPHVTDTALRTFDKDGLIASITLVEILPAGRGDRCRVLAELPLAPG